MQVNSISNCRQNFKGYLIARTSKGDTIKVDASNINKIVKEIDDKATINYIDHGYKSFQVKYNDFKTVLAAYTAAMQCPIGIVIDISEV